VRTVLVLGLGLLSACDEGRRAETVIRALVSATSRHDGDAVVALQVSPEQLDGLVECTGPAGEAPWLRADHRRAKLDAMRSRVEGELAEAMLEIVLVSWEPEQRDDPGEWRTYRPGDTVYGGCRAQRAFGVEKYRVVLDYPRGDFHGSPGVSKPIVLWRIDGDAYAWSDLMD